MFSLTKKLRREVPGEDTTVKPPTGNVGRISIRDRLLLKEFNDINSNLLLPESCKLDFPNPDQLHTFHLTIRPKEGFWMNGKFLFHVNVTEEYNFSPPTVICQTQLWHPNINEEGRICLSLLRDSITDELGWVPTRTVKDVIWGLNSLFTDLLNFDDPLNQEAAKMYKENKDTFQKKVNEYIRKYC